MDDLQTELDATLPLLSRVRDERRDRGCISAIGAGGSVLGLLFGLALTVGGEGTQLAGFSLEVVSLFGLYASILAHKDRPPTLQQAEARLVDIAGRVEEFDTLRLDGPARSVLREVITDAEPGLAVAILRILGTGGEASSLALANAILDSPWLYAAGKDRHVQRAASEAAVRIEKRLEIARRSSTLLRPAGSHAEQELLRLAIGNETAPELLLRAQDGERE